MTEANMTHKNWVFWAALIFSSTVSAQTVEVMVDGPKPVKLIKPHFPKEANDFGIGGIITVPIEVNKMGNVVSVKEPLGPYPVCPTVKDPSIVLLRAAATSAAKASTFEQNVGEASVLPRSAVILYEFFPKTRFAANKLVGMVVSGEALEGTAMSIPKPSYPVAARAVKAGGPVDVRVLIEEDGTVHSAQAIKGHPLLRAAAESAACKATFTPTLLSDHPVKVSGIVVYNFVP